MRPPDGREERAAAVALARQLGLEHAGLADRLEQSDPCAALAAQLGSLTTLLPEDPGPRIARAADEITDWSDQGFRLFTVRDSGYPDALRSVHDRPALLWMMGDERLGAHPRAIALVGSRHPGEAGRRAAGRFAADLVRANFSVVSGLASGIDTEAHRAAIAAGGRTIAVIGTGLAHAYPRENARLQAELAREHAVISAFWPDDGPAAEHFRRRNAVMSGLSLGTVIIEASARSGTRVQARAALAHGRPVFLRKAVLAERWAAELAQRPGVHVVSDAEEVLRVIETVLEPEPLTAERESIAANRTRRC